MSEILEHCYFCKKNDADPTKSVEFPIHKGSDNTKVVIPRCATCARAQGIAHNWNVLTAILGPFILAVIWVATGTTLYSAKSSFTQTFTCVFPFTIPLMWIAVPLLTKTYLHSLGTVAESAKKKYPKVLKLLESGYIKGGSFVNTPQPSQMPVREKASQHSQHNCLAFHAGGVMSTSLSLHPGYAFVLATLCAECGKAYWTYFDPEENHSVEELLSNATRTDTLTASQLRKLVIEMGHRAVAAGIPSDHVRLKINLLTSQGTVQDITVTK